MNDPKEIFKVVECINHKLIKDALYVFVVKENEVLWPGYTKADKQTALNDLRVQFEQSLGHDKFTVLIVRDPSTFMRVYEVPEEARIIEPKKKWNDKPAKEAKLAEEAEATR